MACARELPAPSLELIPPDEDEDERCLLQVFLSLSYECFSWKPKTNPKQRPSEHSLACKFPDILLKIEADLNDNPKVHCHQFSHLHQCTGKKLAKGLLVNAVLVLLLVVIANVEKEEPT